MKKRFINIVKEVISLFVGIFSRIETNVPILIISNKIKKMGVRIGVINLIMTLITLGFAFLLKISNMMISLRFVILGIIFFMLYRGQNVISSAISFIVGAKTRNFEMILENEITFRASKIIGNVSEKVVKYDKKIGAYKVMENEPLMNTVKKYLQNLWTIQTKQTFEIIEILSVFVMLVVAIITNNAIPQGLFITIIVVFTILTFFVSGYNSLNRKAYFQKYRDSNNEQHIIVNDMLRVPPIVKRDLFMRIDKFQMYAEKNNKNTNDFYNSFNLSHLLLSCVQVLCQYGIIIVYLLCIDFNSISLATITEISAIIAIVGTALYNVSKIANTCDKHNEMINKIETEREDMELIINVYNRETQEVKEEKIENMIIKPFSIKYLEQSENDKPFTLFSTNTIAITKGEIVLLYGTSGSGKSTFMKMVTKRIQLEKSTNIPETSRFLCYDEKLTFGSLSIYEELFCCLENPDLIKMEEILTNLHLWDEIQSTCSNVWKWAKEKKFSNSLSNGQRQRLILAKLLYWMDEDIDVVILDECTSGLDDKSTENSADAEKVLEYIIRYCNQDKKRTIFIATHQNIDGVRKKLGTEFLFKTLFFQRGKDSNNIMEV